MSMSENDFLSSFKEPEIKEVKLTTWSGNGDGIIHLRGLPYSEVNRFHQAAEAINQRKAMGFFSADKVTYEVELGRAEDYLIKASLCDSQGQQLFTSDDTFNKWKECVKSETVEEILAHVRLLTNLSRHFEVKAVEEDLKKK